MSFCVHDISPYAELLLKENLINNNDNDKNNDSVSSCWASDWFELLLKKIAIAKLGPTVTSRWLFIAANCVYNALFFNANVIESVDTQYWVNNNNNNNRKKAIVLNNMQAIVEHACQHAFPLLIRTYMSLPLTNEEVDAIVRLHTPIEPVNPSDLENLRVEISSYLSARDGDGWKLTTTFNGTLPNGSNTIDVTNINSQNLNNLPDTLKWTPLSFNGATKRYLTPEWGTVNRGVIPEADWQVILGNALELFPSTNDFIQEMRDVEAVTENLTEKQKMIAEFWAGGPGSVTPPGMWMVFTDLAIRSNELSLLHEIRLYTLIATGLYQAGISAWRLKRDKLQARPVQMIRELYYQQQINGWSSSISGEFWMPYQTSDFVTPPFPDFVSGHSTFSATSARLLFHFFQNDVITLKKPVTSGIVQYLSPMFKSSQNVNVTLNDMFIYPHRGIIEPSVPLSGISLEWNRWSDMAKDSGESRIYGGIHVESSNQAGLLLGKQLGDYLWNMMKGI